MRKRFTAAVINADSSSPVFSSRTPVLVIRSSVSAPFYRVIRSRQPECRRGRHPHGRGMGDYEELVLPFDDGRMNVRLVHALIIDG